eukprot:365616-Chlamydomonas_euryale.AAC.7
MGTRPMLCTAAGCSTRSTTWGHTAATYAWSSRCWATTCSRSSSGTMRRHACASQQAVQVVDA